MAILGDVNVMASVMFGGTSNAMRDVIHQEHQAFIKEAPSTWAATFINRSKELYESYNGAAAMQLIQNAFNHISAAQRPDVIYGFKRIEEFQTAQPMMQEYIMAHPRTRERYHANMCDGYSDSYIDPAPGVIGFGHRAYEHVMDGVMDLKDPENAQYTSYSNAWTNETTQVLDIYQRASLLNTYAELDKLFDLEDRDPTSPWNQSL